MGRRCNRDRNAKRLSLIHIFLNDVFADINIYDDDIRLLQRRFVSPIGSGAISFYKFYLDVYKRQPYRSQKIHKKGYIVLSIKRNLLPLQSHDEMKCV